MIFLKKLISCVVELRFKKFFFIIKEVFYSLILLLIMHCESYDYLVIEDF